MISVEVEVVTGKLFVTSDHDQLEKIAQAVYPPEMAFVSVDEDTDCVLILRRKGEAIGYATLEVANRYVADIAVLPNYRRYVLHLLEKMQEVMARKRGVWSATCRPTTSLPMLRALENRGRIRILDICYSHEWAGEEMVDVEFKIIK